MFRSASAASAVLLVALASTSTTTTTIVVNAFPNGAGGCAGGMPAVGGPHLLATSSGGLEVGLLELTVNGNLVPPGQTTLSLTAGEEHELILTATGGTPFRGVLMRGSGPTEVEMTTADELLSAAAACGCDSTSDVCLGTVAGITHISRDDKVEAQALLLSEVAGMGTLDITVVTALTPATSTSTYYYTGWTIEFVDGDVEDTDVPTVVPVAAPVAAPVVAPVVAPTDAPVVAPVSPAFSPALVDDDVESNIPSDLPSNIPSGAPSMTMDMTPTAETAPTYTMGPTMGMTPTIPTAMPVPLSPAGPTAAPSGAAAVTGATTTAGMVLASVVATTATAMWTMILA